MPKTWRRDIKTNYLVHGGSCGCSWPHERTASLEVWQRMKAEAKSHLLWAKNTRPEMVVVISARL